ncbi:hypothetical protein GQ43DRAFT_485858 [Delitschia confertaspora ATCC 74209]|uniref:SnoaL-like polyketide cyclase n=1 Tax=Delitschia confertaspora ATCC 74209 TaxID=1513339 RepID=A0A9P4JM99_9PLEO|nr:hypothetical protein GQ43DRAFT_485858 [Delitschia confertaspora ATCC 74209]
MRTTLFTLVLAPLLAIAAPTGISNTPSRIVERAPSVVTPPPCVAMNPAPSVNETKARHDKFANAFLVKKNLTEAFEYIGASYKNHNPAAKDGPNSALDILGPVWPNAKITVLRTAFKDTQGWLNYRVSGMGEIVDRYRWEKGCIVEHWDQGEKFPSDTKK